MCVHVGVGVGVGVGGVCGGVSMCVYMWVWVRVWGVSVHELHSPSELITFSSHFITTYA